MVVTQADLKEQITNRLDSLSVEELHDILDFVEYQRFKRERAPSDQPTTPYKPVKLGGIAPELDLSEEEIDKFRREMWCGSRDHND